VSSAQGKLERYELQHTSVIDERIVLLEYRTTESARAAQREPSGDQ